MKDNQPQKDERKVISFRLPVSLVKSARAYQRKFARADNLSGLVENMLREFVSDMKEFEPHYEKFQKELSKMKESGVYGIKKPYSKNKLDTGLGNLKEGIDKSI